MKKYLVIDMSDLELKILKVLQKDKVKFEKEKTYSDLRRGRYRFDFFCPDIKGGALIEVQGEQHYKRNPKFFKTLKDFTAAQERDRRKIQYCLAHRIPLYCIPYWEIENIKSSKDIFQDKFRAKTKWKNDEDWRNFQNSI